MLRFAVCTCIAVCASVAQALVYVGPSRQLPSGSGQVEADGGIVYVITTAGLEIFEHSPAGYLPLATYAGSFEALAVAGGSPT